MNTVWVLVCDAARGRLFDVHGDEPTWHLLETFKHDESRSKSSELVGDRSGRGSPQGGSLHHNVLAAASSPKEVEQGHFAHTLATMLDQAMRSKRFQWWVLVAPPHFLGMLKKELTSELDDSLMAMVAKDLSHLDSRELASHLRDEVRMAPDQRDVVRAPTEHHH